MIGEVDGLPAETGGTRIGHVLDAIARGVEARLACTLLGDIVMDQTASIARKLRIPEGEIMRWQSFRRLRLEFAADQGELANLPGMADKRPDSPPEEAIPQA